MDATETKTAAHGALVRTSQEPHTSRLEYAGGVQAFDISGLEIPVMRTGHHVHAWSRAIMRMDPGQLPYPTAEQVIDTNQR